MGKIAKSVVGSVGRIFGNPIASTALFGLGGLAASMALNKGNKRSSGGEESAQSSQQLRDYQNALATQQRSIESEHAKRQTELAESQRRTTEGLARSNRARRQGGIFAEAQTTNAGAASGSLG